jgi:hypothetical protein
MKRLIQIILILISCSLPQIRRDVFRLPDEVTRELNRKKIRRRKRKLKEKIRTKRLSHPHYRSSRPRDGRFSDQRRLRRMYRNV